MAYHFVLPLLALYLSSLFSNGLFANEISYEQHEVTYGTNINDVKGLTTLQNKFLFLQAWTGDPCVGFVSWSSWVVCNTDTSPRVIALNLGNNGYLLSGTLPDFSSMDALETIDLSNNYLTGSIPDFLGTLPNLKELNLANNDFRGTIPASLLNNKNLNLTAVIAVINRDYNSKESMLNQNHSRNGFGMKNVECLDNIQHRKGFLAVELPPKFTNQLVLPISICSGLSYRSYSSPTSGTSDKASETVVSAASDVGALSGSGSDWVDTANDAWISDVDGIAYLREFALFVERFLDSNPYLRDVIVLISGTLAVTVLAWAVMPRIFKRFHRYSNEGPAALLSGTTLWGPVPYEKSFWGALEVPLRYAVTFVAFSQIAMMVAPATIAVQYIQPAWRGAIVISFIWFLQRWKANVFSRALEATSMNRAERDKSLTLDRISSVGLFALGSMAFAEACGVGVQSILTVGGIGGVATAFAAKDILGNVLSGLSVQMSQPFSLGDTIKSGSVEGQVMEMGLTTTTLLSAEKFPVIVPNSLFSSQVIVNKSRAQWRAMTNKIPLQIDDTSKIPLISEDIKSMLRSNEKVFLEKEQPYCFLSQVDQMGSELTLGCNMKQMRKDEMFEMEQEILLQSVKIIQKHGVNLGSFLGP